MVTPKLIGTRALPEKRKRHPHELVIDLGAQCNVRGFRYLARQDGGWNGAVKDCEFFVSDSATEFGQPILTTAFKKSKEPQEASCDPQVGRYVRVRVLSEVNAGPSASISEFGVIGRSDQELNIANRSSLAPKRENRHEPPRRAVISTLAAGIPTLNVFATTSGTRLDRFAQSSHDS